MLNPVGTLSFANGNLSSAAGIGGGATGASFEAASLPAGRPIRGEPGGSGAPAGAGAAGVLAGWAEALSVNALRKAPASNRPRGVELMIMKSSLSGNLILALAPMNAGLGWLSWAAVSDIFPPGRNRKDQARGVAGRRASVSRRGRVRE